jgi:hypothetical protein
MAQTRAGKLMTMNEVILNANAPIDMTVLTDTVTVTSIAGHILLPESGAYYVLAAIGDDVYIKEGADGVAPTTAVEGYGFVIGAGSAQTFYLIGPYLGYITTSTASLSIKKRDRTLY